MTHSKIKKVCAHLKKMILLLFLIMFFSFSRQVIVQAEQGFEMPPLTTEETYDNFMSSLLNQKVFESLRKHYGKEFTGFQTSEDFVEIKELPRENLQKNGTDVKYIVTYKLSPFLKSNGDKVRNGTDILHFEVITDYLEEGDTTNGIKLIKYEENQ